MRSMLSASEGYRKFLGASTAASGPTFDSTVITWDSTTITFDMDITTLALATVHVDAFDPPGDAEEYTAIEWAAAFNGGLIWLDPDGGFQKYRDSDTGYDERGQLWLRLRRMVPSADLDDPEKASRDFKNDSGLVLTDLAELAPLPGYIRIGNMTQHGPFESETRHKNPRPWLGADYQFDWHA